MTDFDERLQARLERLDAAIPSARLPTVSVADGRQADTARGRMPHRWPGRKAALGLAAAAVLAVASVATAQRVLFSDVPPPGLEAALEEIFTGSDCVTLADAKDAIHARLEAAGAADWEIRTQPGAGAPCVAAGIVAEDHLIILLPSSGRVVAEAMERTAEELMRRCLGRDEAIRFVSSVLTSLGVTDFSVSADPWGPQGGPADQIEAYREHVAAGCFVYSGMGRDANGRAIYYLWGSWP
jgi:hypothetical protein